MADENVITSFLVALGFDVKANEERRFVDSISKAKVAALALAGTLTALVATIEKVASGYEQLYYASQRMGASVANIQAFSYAMSQVGGSAAGAAAALESLGSFLRSGPGAESFMQRLGIQTRDANGGLRDTTAQLQDFFRVAKTMPYYRARAYANVLGIDDRTLQAGMRGLGEFSGELKGMYRAAGIDSQAAAAGSAKFMQQLRSFGAALQVLRDKVGISLEHGVGGIIERLKRLLVANFGRISDAIVNASKIIIGLGWALMVFVSHTASLIGRLIDWFNSLDSGTRMWIVALGLLVAAISSPIFAVTALGVALEGLIDDYLTWKRGGDSLIDWKQWEPGITSALKSIKEIGDALRDIWPKVQPNLEKLAGFIGHKLFDQLGSTLREISLLMQALDAAMNHQYGKAAQLLWQSSIAALNAFQPSSGDIVSDAVTSIADMPRRNRNEAIGYSLIRASGIDRTHALAMLGNWEQESSGLDPRAYSKDQKGVPHVGIEQWDPSRVDSILKGTGIDVRTASYEDQVKASIWESLRGGEKGRSKAFFANTDLKNSAGLYATDVERSGEHPGMVGFDSRINNSVNADSRLRYADDVQGAPAAAAPTIHAPMTTTINVNGTGQPEQVAQSVAKKQDWVGTSMVRNMIPQNY